MHFGKSVTNLLLSRTVRVVTRSLHLQLTILKLAMSEMMSSFKTELLTHVNESISHVYQDFEQVAELAAQDETISVSEVEPLPKESTDSLGKITAFAQQTASQPQTQTNITTESTVFKAFVEQFATAEKPGPAIDHDLATIVNELLTEKLTKEKLEPVQQKYLRPENCENLVTPKINKPIWLRILILHFKKSSNCCCPHCMPFYRFAIVFPALKILRIIII